MRRSRPQVSTVWLEPKEQHVTSIRGTQYSDEQWLRLQSLNALKPFEIIFNKSLKPFEVT